MKDANCKNQYGESLSGESVNRSIGRSQKIFLKTVHTFTYSPIHLPAHSPIHHSQLILNSRKGGFTLLEVLIASAILSIILMALYSTFFLSHKAIAGLEGSMLKLQECRAAIDMLRKEIDASFYRAGDEKTIFKLEDRDIYGKQTSRLIFTTLSPLRIGVSEIKYLVKESDNKLILYKEISSLFGSKEKIEADIIEGIEEFIIETKHNDKWVKTWDSTLVNRLPEEVKISLKIKIKGRDVLLFVTARPMIT